MAQYIKYYEKKEEVFNVATHGLGFLLSLAGLSWLVVQAALHGNVWHIVSFSVFGATLVVLYLASTLYHMAKRRALRHRLNIFDHAAIYLLIAGTYTPFALVSLNGPWGWSIFGVVWGLALVGVTLKFFFIGKYDRLSTVAYVLMGWVILVAIKPLLMAVSAGGLLWLFAGGLSYTVGAWFYLKERLRYNHGIFHLFVLAGSACHFFAVWLHLL